MQKKIALFLSFFILGILFFSFPALAEDDIEDCGAPEVENFDPNPDSALQYNVKTTFKWNWDSDDCPLLQHLICFEEADNPQKFSCMTARKNNYLTMTKARWKKVIRAMYGKINPAGRTFSLEWHIQSRYGDLTKGVDNQFIEESDPWKFTISF